MKTIEEYFFNEVILTSYALSLVYGDPNQALFFGGMGIVAALVFGNMGAAYGTAKSGVGICSVAVLKPELIIKSIIPVVMAGILGIYGLIISVIISGSCKSRHPPLSTLTLLLCFLQ